VRLSVLTRAQYICRAAHRIQEDPMTERVTFKSRAGDETSGALALPAGSGKAPALMVLQEYWGVNDHIKDLCARFAAEGFIALAPDIYRGVITKDAGEAMKLLQGLDWGRAVGDMGGAVDYLRAHPRSNGKVAVTGFCMGGALTLVATTTIKGLAAAVPFYGLPPQGEWAKVECPVQGHFCATDEWAKPALARDIQTAVQASGGAMELNVYDAQHAFMNDTRPEVHHPENAKVAWGRAITFLKQHTA
jgi:carboxymethylenebutenolidase